MVQGVLKMFLLLLGLVLPLLMGVVQVQLSAICLCWSSDGVVLSQCPCIQFESALFAGLKAEQLNNFKMII